MPRPRKYSSSELASLAHDYHVLKREQELRAKIVTKLGSKCDRCGSTNERHLKLVGKSPKSWAQRWRDVKNFPEAFKLTCANCDIEALHRATEKRLDEMSHTLLQDVMKQSSVEPVENSTKHTVAVVELAKKALDDHYKKMEIGARLMREAEERLAKEEYEKQFGPGAVTKVAPINTVAK